MGSGDEQTDRHREVLFREYARADNAVGLRELLANEALVRRILSSEANPILKQTPIYVAARYNKPDAIAILLRFGADANRADKDGSTPLAIAQEKNKKRAVAALLNPARLALPKGS